MENKNTKSEATTKQTTSKTTTQTKKLSDIKNIQNQNKTLSKDGQKIIHNELSNNSKNANYSDNNENIASKHNNNQDLLQKSNKLTNSKNQKNKSNKWLILLAFVGGSLIIGLLSSLLGGKMREDYIKPPAYPPDLLFTIVWCVLYVMIGISGYLAYMSQQEKQKRIFDTVWLSVHMFFNLFWTLIFFRFDMLILASIWLGIMIATSIVVTYRYYRSNLASGIMFTIYTLWLIFAMYLTLAITLLNVSGSV